jgi:hypothetical protein
LEVTGPACAWGAEEYHKDVRISGLRAEFWNMQLWNTKRRSSIHSEDCSVWLCRVREQLTRTKSNFHKY